MTTLDETPYCWRCGASLARQPLPLGREAVCAQCNAQLHVCRQCAHFDPGKSNQCREPMAERVVDKTRANFCDWFQARRGPLTQANTPRKAALEALFLSPGAEPGNTDTTPEASEPRAALDRLFKS
ncbi:MAG: hypothetical protein AB1421_10270 [Pseudomonadota bacterium]